jgi:hypothetical protein
MRVFDVPGWASYNQLGTKNNLKIQKYNSFEML